MKTVLLLFISLLLSCCSSYKSVPELSTTINNVDFWLTNSNKNIYLQKQKEILQEKAASCYGKVMLFGSENLCICVTLKVEIDPNNRQHV